MIKFLIFKIDLIVPEVFIGEIIIPFPLIFLIIVIAVITVSFVSCEHLIIPKLFSKFNSNNHRPILFAYCETAKGCDERSRTGKEDRSGSAA